MVLGTPEYILAFIQEQSYLFLFLLLLLEGPLVTYVAAFAASLGLFNIYYVFIFSVLGNMIGDLVYYGIGHFSTRASLSQLVVKWIDKDKREKIRRLLHTHPGKVLLVIKLTPPLPLPGLIFTGAAGLRFLTFFKFSTAIAITTSLLLTIVGYYSGVAFGIIPQYFKYEPFAIIALVVFVLVIRWVWKLVSQKLSQKIEPL